MHGSCQGAYEMDGPGKLIRVPDNFSPAFLCRLLMASFILFRGRVRSKLVLFSSSLHTRLANRNFALLESCAKEGEFEQMPQTGWVACCGGHRDNLLPLHYSQD